jgi:hypothetical protein
MKIGYFSDLHTEFLRPDVLTDRQDMRQIGLETFARMLGKSYAEADVIVAAGDIGTGVQAINFLLEAFPNKPVIYVPGNHDHWGGEYYSVIRKMREAAHGTNVHFFHDGGTVEIEGVVFCAGTLWTDYALFDLQDANLKRAVHTMNDFRYIEMQDQRRYRAVKEAMWEALDVMNDHRKIRFRKNGARLLDAPRDALGNLKREIPRRLTPQDILGFHKVALRNIETAMAEAFATYRKLVVVSHHAPSRLSLLLSDEGLDQHVYEKHDPFYASHLDYLMEGDDAPLLWIHGHTHIATRYLNGNTIVASNPKGYDMDSEFTGWQPGRMIKLETLQSDAISREWGDQYKAIQ